MKKLSSSKLKRKDLEKYLSRMPKLSSIPLGLVETPFNWDYLGKIFPMKFVSGFVAVE